MSYDTGSQLVYVRDNFRRADYGLVVNKVSGKIVFAPKPCNSMVGRHLAELIARPKRYRILRVVERKEDGDKGGVLPEQGRGLGVETGEQPGPLPAATIPTVLRRRKVEASQPVHSEELPSEGGQQLVRKSNEVDELLEDMLKEEVEK